MDMLIAVIISRAFGLCNSALAAFIFSSETFVNHALFRESFASVTT